MDRDLPQAAAGCRECGAASVDGMSCWGQLGALLAGEYQDAELRAEHFLTVACYNLQHPAQFTDEVVAGLRSALVDYLDHEVSVKELRRRAARAYEGNKRVLRDAVERRPSLRSWSTTIADVYLPDKPQDAAARVRAWAARIRNELYQL